MRETSKIENQPRSEFNCDNYITFNDDTPCPLCKSGVTGTEKVCPWAFEFNTFSAKRTLYMVIRLSWERPKLPMPSLFLGQTEACGGEKNYFSLRSDLPLIVGIRWVGLVHPFLVDLSLPVLLILAVHECLKLSLFSRKELGRIWPFLSFSVYYFNNNNCFELFLSAHFTVYFRIALNWLTLQLLRCHQL